VRTGLAFVSLSNLNRFVKFFYCVKEEAASNASHVGLIYFAILSIAYVAALPCEITGAFIHDANLDENENRKQVYLHTVQFI